MSGYNQAAVEAAIKAHNRSPRGGKISGREARLIHALLRGRAPANQEKAIDA